jgi:GNAT superfamily N-acetyltransferase
MLAGDGSLRIVVAAEAEGQVVGLASAQILISTAEGGPAGLVEDVVVAEGWRGRGIGRKLVAALEQWAATRGATRLQLLADRDNRPALRFYDAIGWERTRLICLRKKGTG